MIWSDRNIGIGQLEREKGKMKVSKNEKKAHDAGENERIWMLIRTEMCAKRTSKSLNKDKQMRIWEKKKENAVFFSVVFLRLYVFGIVITENGEQKSLTSGWYLNITEQTKEGGGGGREKKTWKEERIEKLPEFQVWSRVTHWIRSATVVACWVHLKFRTFDFRFDSIY